MNLKIFIFFYVLAFILIYRLETDLLFSLFVAVPLSPFFAMVAMALYEVQTKIWNFIGKDKPKTDWWKDTGGY